MALLGRPQKVYREEQKTEIKNYYKKCKNTKEQKRILSLKLRVIKGLTTKRISEITELSASSIVDRLRDGLVNLSNNKLKVKSITGWNWILSAILKNN